MMGLVKKTAWTHWCIRCDKKFVATGRQVKICDKCKKPTNWKKKTAERL